MTTVTSNELTPEQVRDSKIYTQWGLTEAEYDLIVAELKRLPTIRKRVFFLACGLNTCRIRNQSQFYVSSGQQMNASCKDQVKGRGS